MLPQDGTAMKDHREQALGHIVALEVPWNPTGPSRQFIVQFVDFDERHRGSCVAEMFMAERIRAI
jgi:hypothetical protein